MLEKKLFRPCFLRSSVPRLPRQVSGVSLMRLKSVSLLSFAPNFAVCSLAHLGTLEGELMRESGTYLPRAPGCSRRAAWLQIS